MFPLSASIQADVAHKMESKVDELTNLYESPHSQEAVVDRYISTGDVPVDKEKAPIMSSSPGIGLLSFFQNL